MTTIVWFRHDLRLSDNPALYEAAKLGPVIPIFIWAPEEEGAWKLGGASKWWLHQSLLSLEKSLEDRGLTLIYQKGSSLNTLKKIIKETKAERVFWNRRYEPAIVQRDAKIKEEIRGLKVEVKSFNGTLLVEPWEIATKEKKPYQVFTSFWKTAEKHPLVAPLPTPRSFEGVGKKIHSLELADFELEPKIDWAKGIKKAWQVGEKSALQHFRSFIKDSIQNYLIDRDFPGIEGVSKMSPHLHFGEISSRIMIHEISKVVSSKELSDVSSSYIRQLYWREFAYHLLFHFPQTAEHALRKDFEDFPWHYDQKLLKAWQTGKTGYPIVDAGMHQLWITGWMHNRVRLIVASFLTKDLLLSWQEGSRWFWDTLVDADLANNTLGWQWTAGCGADAAPYFRIFNPVTQGEKFDPEGSYVRHWVPVLKNMPTQWIHKPWEAPAEILEKAGVILGKNYPLPLVDHSEARKMALSAFDTIKKR